MTSASNSPPPACWSAPMTTPTAKGQHHGQQAARQTNGMAIIPQWEASNEPRTIDRLQRPAPRRNCCASPDRQRLENFTTEPAGPAMTPEPDVGERSRPTATHPGNARHAVRHLWRDRTHRRRRHGGQPYAACMNAMVSFPPAWEEVYLSIGDGVSPCATVRPASAFQRGTACHGLRRRCAASSPPWTA